MFKFRCVINSMPNLVGIFHVDSAGVETAITAGNAFQIDPIDALSCPLIVAAIDATPSEVSVPDGTNAL